MVEELTLQTSKVDGVARQTSLPSGRPTASNLAVGFFVLSLAEVSRSSEQRAALGSTHGLDVSMAPAEAAGKNQLFSQLLWL